MKKILISLIKFYRKYISPGRSSCCRFTPTCSQYALDAINKYGVNAFRRYTLAVFDTAEEAFSLESKIVNEEFIKKPYVYNAIVGGKKGPDQSITIYQYDLEGAFIDSYSSYKKAAECFGCSTTSIENAVKFKSTSQKSL